MAQNEQNPSNSTNLREIATTIATSTSPGTNVNTLALSVVLWYAISNIFAPLQPSSAIDLLENATKEVADVYDRNKGILGDGESFESDLDKLELAVLELKEKQIQGLNISWLSPAYLSNAKYMWATAWVHRREADALKSKLELAIIRAKKGSLRRALDNRRDVVRGDLVTGLTNDASAV